jgi:hypothetical protein
MPATFSLVIEETERRAIVGGLRLAGGFSPHPR